MTNLQAILAVVVMFGGVLFFGFSPIGEPYDASVNSKKNSKEKGKENEQEKDEKI